MHFRVRVFLRKFEDNRSKLARFELTTRGVRRSKCASFVFTLQLPEKFAAGTFRRVREEKIAVPVTQKGRPFGRPFCVAGTAIFSSRTCRNVPTAHFLWSCASRNYDQQKLSAKLRIVSSNLIWENDAMHHSQGAATLTSISTFSKPPCVSVSNRTRTFPH